MSQSRVLGSSAPVAANRLMATDLPAPGSPPMRRAACSVPSWTVIGRRVRRCRSGSGPACCPCGVSLLGQGIGVGSKRVASDEERVAVAGVVAFPGDADFFDLQAGGERVVALLEGGDAVAAGDPDGDEFAGEDVADASGFGAVTRCGPSGASGWRVGGSGVDDGSRPGSADARVPQGGRDDVPGAGPGDEAGDEGEDEGGGPRVGDRLGEPVVGGEDRGEDPELEAPAHRCALGGVRRCRGRRRDGTGRRPRVMLCLSGRGSNHACRVRPVLFRSGQAVRPLTVQASAARCAR
jgi:hypothetical protein